MTVILDHITTIDYTSGNNLKGQGVGTNWTFLLPQLDLRRVLCIGTPSGEILPTLQLLSDELICTQPSGNSDVTVQPLERMSTSSVDLIYVCDTRAATLAELKRVLKPDGLLYYEYYGRDRTGFAEAGTAKRFWLTPTVGYMQTAVCLEQENSTAFIRRNQLYTSSIRHQTLTHLGKRLAGKPAPLTVLQDEDTLQASSTAQNKAPFLKNILYTVLRHTRKILIHSGAQIEQSLIHSPVTARWTQRFGAIVQNGKKASGEPPLYLQFGAEQCGIDIRQWEWAFVAKGDFPSQKLLFYLFPENTQKPFVIVKMVREPQYNERLEREYRGLNHLGNLEFVHKHTIPQVMFQGYQHDLFFIGESVLEGQPFVNRTSFDAKCNYARFVVQWLIDLGVATHTDADGAQVADLLMPLYKRFSELYHPNVSQQRFLEQQLKRLSQADNIPLVLRHGDPGLQNLLITPDDTVAFLDWENAEIKGLPLWDVFYFLSAYSIKAGQVNANYSSFDAYEHYFLNKSPIQPLVLDAINRYCETIGLDRSLILPLYYLFWMYRALKQSPMVNPSQLQNALTWRLLQLSISLRDSGTLQAFK